VDEEGRQAAALAADALGHPVSIALPGAPGPHIVAGSVVGDPPQARVAWVRADDGEIIARVACPPGRPSRWRPVTAASVLLEVAGTVNEHVLATLLAPEAVAMRPILNSEEEQPAVTAAEGGLALARLPTDAIVVAVDALDAGGEPVGHLVRAGVTELRADGGSVSGRLGVTHGMAAGIGNGRWSPGLAEAEFEIGYAPWLPGWMPPRLEQGPPRVEPDVAYPAAPPALVLAWTGAGGARVLLRQAPAPLASPDLGGRHARSVRIGTVPGVLRGRGLVTLVWETPERAFGLQVRSVPDPEAIALRVARSISAPGGP
jgi:hypothetical protein